jgi:Tfp pilus assembly protein PilO
MLANRTSRWSIGTALLCVVLLAASWFLLIGPRRAEAEDVRAQAVQENSQAALLQQQLADLKTQYAALPKKMAELKAIKQQLPPDADVPSLVRSLQDYAARAGVSVDSITPGVPAVLAADGSVSTNATAGVGSLVSLPLSVVVTGQYFENSLFVKYLQTRLTRSFLISGLATAAAASSVTVTAAPTPAPTGTSSASTNDDLTMTITGAVFVLLDDSSTLQDVAVDAKKATLGTPAATATGGTTTTTR